MIYFILVVFCMLTLVYPNNFEKFNELIELYPYTQQISRIKLDEEILYYRLNNLIFGRKYEVRVSYLGSMRLQVYFEQLRIRKQSPQQNLFQSQRNLLETEKILVQLEEEQKVRKSEKDLNSNQKNSRKLSKNDNSVAVVNKEQKFTDNQQIIKYTPKNLVQRSFFSSRKLLDLEKIIFEADENFKEEEEDIIIRVRMNLFSPSVNQQNTPQFVDFTIVLSEVVLGGILKDSIPIIVTGIFLVFLVILFVPVWSKKVVPRLVNWMMKKEGKVKD